MRRSIAFLTAGLLLVAFAYAATLLGVAGAAAPWSLAAGTAIVIGAMLALAARRRGRPMRVLSIVAVLAGLALAAGLGVALAAPPARADGPLLLGLPRTTALLLGLAGLVPLVALPLAYAAVFDREVMGDDAD